MVPDKELIRRHFVIAKDPELCSVHLINGGVTVVGHNATVEFASSGPVQGFKCKLDRVEYYECMLRLTVCTYSTACMQLGWVDPAHIFLFDCLHCAMIQCKTCSTD